MTAPDPTPSATLAGIRERYRRCGNSPDIHVNLEGWIDSAEDIPLLLKVAEAVLALADDWERELARLEPSGADAVSNAGPGSYLVSGRLGALEDCAAALREAITTALTGTPQPSEEARDG